MALTICHTADWHLGHTLFRRSREPEHAAFLAWLLERLVERRADVLIVAGDVFDTGSPPGSALAMFYGFLAAARRLLPRLTIVVVAGNHDSPARLAAPDPLLRAHGVIVVGGVPYDGDRVAVERLVAPVIDDGVIAGCIVAIPFLRSTDVHMADDFVSGARAVYDAAIAHAIETARGAPIVVTGHFAATGARMSIDSERRIAVGADGTLPIDVIDTREVAYVALGHLHLSQRVPGARVEARYSGSPIPLAFSERAFEHEVRFVTIDGRRVESEGVRVPRTVSLLRVPEGGAAPREMVIDAIRAFPGRAGAGDASGWPWVEARVTARRDERDVVEAIEEAASDRAIHLVRVAVERPEIDTAREERLPRSFDVRDVLAAHWHAEHGEAPDDEVLRALDDATAEARRRIDERKRDVAQTDRTLAFVTAHRAASRRGVED
jgi:exonuclease SbcD